jgi:hypothetical protein
MTANLHRAGAMLALSLMAGLSAAQPAQAYSLEGPIWANHRTNFWYAVGGAPSGAFSTALRQALAEWNPLSAFKYVPTNKFSNPCNSSGPNGAAMRPTACGRAFGSGVLGITMYSFTSGNRFIHAGTVFNSRASFGIYDGPLRSGSTDFRRVATHEMGHALGMGHENNSNIPAIMQPFISNTDRPTADDRAGIRAMYGPP